MLRGYYFITDSKLTAAGNESDVKKAIAAGASVIQYREKSLSTAAMYTEALRLKAICRDTLFLINDRVDIALAMDADGVHIGQDDMPYSIARRLLGKRRIIGLTVHTLSQAKEAEDMGADYIGLSPIFATSTKADAGKPCGVELLKKIKKHISIPIIALGGIDLKNAEEVIAAGADGICAISAVVTRGDVRKEIEKFQKLF